MPRTRLPGGTRAGAPGRAYGNRTDLNTQKSLPLRVAQNQTYGAAQAQMDAQKQIPMAPPPSATPTAPTTPPQGGMGPITPGMFGDMHRPTERPTEPVTAGAPLGPGPGPEAIPRGPTNPVNTNLSDMLAQLAQSSGSNAVQQLAQRAQAAGA